jgi:NADH-quinone oxidoreductase subunit G
MSGTGSGSAAVIKAAADVAQALCKDGRTAALCYTVAECNSIGVGLMGGKSIREAFVKVKEADIESVIILENDLYRRAEREKVDAFLDEAKNVIVIDHLLNRTSAKADMLFPAGTFAEADGTFVNNEGRSQRFFQVFVPDGEIKESWRWLRDMMAAAGRTDAEDWHSIDDIIDALAEAFPVFRPVRDAAPGADFRMAGQKIPRQPHRYSGRTAMLAHINVSEPKPPDDVDTPLSFSMEGYPGKPPSPLLSRFWSPGWNSVQSVNKFQMEVGGQLTGGDPGVRLIEPSAAGFSYFADLPPAFEKREGELLIVPLYHIFGSEELSVLSPGVLARSPKPYLALNPADAKTMGIAGGDEIEITVGDRTHRITATHMESLPEGTAGFPAGIYGADFISYPAWARVQSKEKATP